jgi:hypothetical protein
MQIPAFVRQHPGWTTFALGSIVLGAANAAAPDNDFVNAANTVGFLGGMGTGVFANSPQISAIGFGLLGASLIGQAVKHSTLAD